MTHLTREKEDQTRHVVRLSRPTQGDRLHQLPLRLLADRRIHQL